MNAHFRFCPLVQHHLDCTKTDRHWEQYVNARPLYVYANFLSDLTFEGIH